MKHEESGIQKAIVVYLRANRILVFAVPNGGRRGKVEAAIMKAEGVLAGVADMIALVGGRPYFLEVKTAKGRQSPAQKEFQKAVEAQGCEYRVLRNLDDAIAFVADVKKKQLTESI